MEKTIEKEYNLIITIVDRGYADIVIEAAKSSGAKGSTVIFARGTGVESSDDFLKIPIRPEKEVVLTFVTKETAKEIVTAITAKAGLSKEARGISYTLPVTKMANAEDVVKSEK